MIFKVHILIIIYFNQVDLEDKQTFVISSDEDYNENENEMIQREDLSEIESFAEDEQKYEPLHSHVENYNKRSAEKADRLSRSIYLHPITEAPFIEEPKPFIAGFKSELDKVQIYLLKYVMSM